MDFVVVVENNTPDIENQLEQVKEYLENTRGNMEYQQGIKQKYFRIVEAGYNVFSHLPLDKIRPVVFNVFVNSFNKLVTA